MDKLNIQSEMRAFDRKDRAFYDSLTDQERKKFSLYLMVRWGSGVEGSQDLQEFYVIATNQRLNRHFFAVNRHPKLQWLMATAVSPDMGTQRHRWIPPRKRDNSTNRVKKTLMQLYPTMKMQDIDAMAGMVDSRELAAYCRERGITD